MRHSAVPSARALPRQGRAPAPIPYALHDVDEADRGAVARALASGCIAQGPEVERFERALAGRTGAGHAVAVGSGTAALQVALGALGVAPGDEVIVPPLTFVATANAVLLCGATPVFADVEPVHGTLDPDAVARAVGPRTRGAIAVHYAGHPADVDGIAGALPDGAFVLEDACHALGATWRRRPVGSLGHAACFSFHPAKLITTGEGGAVVSGDAALADAARQLREHGIERRRDRFRGLGLPRELRAEECGEWVYELHQLGANHRLSEPAAALGSSQLRRLDAFLARRRALAAAYDAALRDLDAALELPVERDGARSAWHLYALRVRPAALRGGRAGLFRALRGRGIGVQVHYVPVHLQPWYRARLGTRFGDQPVAEAEYLRLLSLPLFPALSDPEQRHVIEVVRDCVRELRR